MENMLIEERKRILEEKLGRYIKDITIDTYQIQINADEMSILRLIRILTILNKIKFLNKEIEIYSVADYGGMSSWLTIGYKLNPGKEK